MPRKPIPKHVCYRCNEQFEDASNFHKSGSVFYLATGHLPICKDCFDELFRAYVGKYKDKRKALQRMCMAFDLYYSDSIYNSCKDDGDKLIGNYIRHLNMIQYRNRFFDYSINEGFGFGKLQESKIKKEPEEEKKEDVLPENKVRQEDVQKWGVGFTQEEYDDLNAHYKFLKDANPNCDSNQEIFINDLCMTKMMQGQAARDRRIDDYNKLTESYRKSFKDAGLKTINDDSTVNEDCWSSFTAIVSQYSPEEYYKDKNIYQDYFGYGADYRKVREEYIERHAVRPLMNTINGTEERDFEYYVHDGDESYDE